jgi:hypothetical protein
LEAGFVGKKQELKDGGAKHARMLSRLSYSPILSTIKARAFDRGTLALAKNDPFVLVKSDHTKSTLGSGFGARQTRMKIY